MRVIGRGVRLTVDVNVRVVWPGRVPNRTDSDVDLFPKQTHAVDGG